MTSDEEVKLSLCQSVAQILSLPLSWEQLPTAHSTSVLFYSSWIVHNLENPAIDHWMQKPFLEAY